MPCLFSQIPLWTKSNGTYYALTYTVNDCMMNVCMLPHAGTVQQEEPITVPYPM